MPRPMILLLKATIPGGAVADLFAAPVQVAGHMRGHTYVAPHQATRMKAAPEAPGTIAARILKDHPAPTDPRFKVNEAFARRLAMMWVEKNPGAVATNGDMNLVVDRLVSMLTAHSKRLQGGDRQADGLAPAPEPPAGKDWRDEENWHARTQGRMKTLSDDALRYVLKDATEAARAGDAMGSAKAGRYQDEAHYAGMELRAREQKAAPRPAAPAAKGEVPPAVLKRVTDAVAYLQGVREDMDAKLAHGSPSDAQRVHRDAAEFIAQRMAVLDKFREVAARNGADPDAIIAQAGGIPNWSTEPKAAPEARLPAALAVLAPKTVYGEEAWHDAWERAVSTERFQMEKWAATVNTGGPAARSAGVKLDEMRRAIMDRSVNQARDALNARPPAAAPSADTRARALMAEYAENHMRFSENRHARAAFYKKLRDAARVTEDGTPEAMMLDITATRLGLDENMRRLEFKAGPANIPPPAKAGAISVERDARVTDGDRFILRHGGENIGYARVIGQPGARFVDSIQIEKTDKRRSGEAQAIYDRIESEIGEALIPSPLGLHPPAEALWRRRLAGMPRAAALAVVARARAAGMAMGASETSVDARLAPLLPPKP